jgi:putative acetyltransferase
MILEKIAFRAGEPEDRLGILAVQRRAFGGEAEAKLVDRLIEGPEKTISMVADLDGMIVGHILLTELAGPEKSLALAPLGVDPEWRDFLIGTELTNHAIAKARDEGWHSIFVLGDPVYYGRFGFKSGLAEHVGSPWPGPNFMALELLPGAVSDYRGAVTYPDAFSGA